MISDLSNKLSPYLRGIYIMLIKLSKEQQDRLLTWSGEITSAHHNEDSMAPGYELVITVSMLGAEAVAHSGGAELELGDVDVMLE
jgi:hypothetical protein